MRILMAGRQGATTLTLALLCSGLQANTVQLDSVSIEKPEQSENTHVTVRGSGFGQKEKASPVLWLFGDDIRENGTPVEHSVFPTGEPVATTGPKIWEYVDPNIEYSSHVRYPELGHSYFVGNNGTVRNPLAFGGSNPSYHDEVYLAARIKPVEAWHGFRSIGSRDLRGTFDLGPSRYELGEQIYVTNPSSGERTDGRIVFIDTQSGLVTLKTQAGWGKSSLDGSNVLGKSSGATMTLTAENHYSFASGSKYLRMWSNNEKPGLFNTLSTNRLIVGYRDETGNVVARPTNEDGTRDKGYGVPDITSRLDWRLLETYVDQSGTNLSVYVDVDNSSRRYVKNIDISSSYKFTDRTPTLSQLGLAAAGGADTIDAALYFGEIYFDTTPQRIMISDKKTYSEAGSELEIQYPLEWSNDRIKFEFRSGLLDKDSTLYVYIFDENGFPNESGFPICIRCEARTPKPIELFVD